MRDLFAIFAAKGDLLSFPDHGERGLDRLVVRDAFRVDAAHETPDRLGYRHVALFGDPEILDDVDLSHRRDDRDAVQLVLLAEAVVDLDDRFRAHPLALEVRAERDPVRIVLQIENLDDFEQAVGRDMVDDRTVLDGPDFQFSFRVIGHGMACVVRFVPFIRRHPAGS